MSIYTPYFYIIQEVSTGMYYAGSKYGKDANPDNFMTEGGYTTSSKVVNKILSVRGIKSFVVRKLKTFNTQHEVLRYETRFLQKVNAKINPFFYNMHNNDGVYNLTKSSVVIYDLYGVDNIFQLEQTKTKIKNTNLRKYGVYSYSKTSNHRLNISQKFTGAGNPFYGKTHTEEVKEKISDKMSGNKNPFYNKTHTIEAKEKISLGRKGKPPHNKGKTGYKIKRSGKWINDGQENKLLKEGETIPLGFKYGLLKKNKK